MAKPKPEPLVHVVDGVGLLVDEFLADLSSRIFPPGAPAVDFNFDRLEGRTATVARVLDVANTLPAFAPRRLVVVRQAEALVEKRGKDDQDPAAALVAYLERPSPTTTLVLVAAKWDARTRFYKAAKKMGGAVRFDEPSEADLPGVLMERARREGATIEPDAARLLVAGVGADLAEAVAALERLHLYVGPDSGVPIRRADVEALVPGSGEMSVFALVDAIAAGDRQAVLRGLHHVLSEQREPPLKVLALLARQYRLLLSAREAVGRGATAGELAGSLKVPPFVATKLLEQARRLDAGRIARSLSAIQTTDTALKGGSLNDQRAFERLAFSLAQDAPLHPVGRSLPEPAGLRPG